MASSNSRSMLAALSQVNHQASLTNKVRDLPTNQFVDLLDQITREFEHFLRAIDMINNEALETMLEQILEAFTLKIGQILEAERTTIFMVDETKQELWSKIASGESDQKLEIRVSMHKGIAGHVATTGEYLNISDAYEDIRFDSSIDKKTGYRTRNILCMPVFSSRNNVVAVVQLLNKLDQSPFNARDEQNFREFASSIGIILESCNSFYVAARNQKGVAALLKAISSLEQSLDLEKTLQSVMAEARDLMQADRSTLWIVDEDRRELWSKVKTGDNSSMLNLRQPADKGIVGYVASTGTLLNIPNAYEDPRFDPTADQKTGYKTRNILCMPVFDSSGTLIGVTQLINKNQGSFTSLDEEFMRAFNIQAGIALENAKLFESVLVEKQYQKDILQSLSDAVISTDLEGRIVTINDAALELLGCPTEEAIAKNCRFFWEDKLRQRSVWEVIPLDNLQFRLEDSLKNGAKHYVPEQSLSLAIYSGEGTFAQLAIPDSATEPGFRLWGESHQPLMARESVKPIERSLNLTVNPLTNPEGGVLGGLLVLEDISQEKRMKTTLYRYMTPGVADRVMQLGEDSLMVGERREVTVLFSDIRGYTTLTENLEASQVVSLLNDYFETMVEAVFSYEGTLDKFIGDALMAVFGAPLPLQNHAWGAVQSALDMRHRLERFNAARSSKSLPDIRIGIGISSGEVVSGNIGSQRKMEYTVIGDGVNLSSRLEGITKQYGCDIVISEHTYELCKDQIWVRELDRIRVKGKNEPVRIYELIDHRQNELSEDWQEMLDIYGQARHYYINREFEQARQLFEQAGDLAPNDGAVAEHLRRIREYISDPSKRPQAGWDGVYTMTTK
ncbi:MAG: GAF domain-containing protein [Leptolyngbyaceae cyanobacterium SL_1_1]|nr:GAF domain-containing protein [Leptolyngbyaceae cyanobacterium RM1_1_2]NJO09364.1 GAF domain-containing protein [Leptolyngbyaceae cyanobacterium SL_1_1]